MSYNGAVANWIPSWSEDGTNITVPIASFPELTAAEADAATGDIRKTLYAIAKKLYDVWAATAAADRPAKMNVNLSSTTNAAGTVVTKTFTFRFYVDVLTSEVSSE